MAMVAFLAGALLAACGKTPVPEEAAPAEVAQPDPFAFSVEVSLSDAAKRQLGLTGETVIVAASYFAGGREGVAADEFNDVGLIDLGRVEVELDGEGTAILDGSGVRKDRLGLVEGEPEVNVNVYSGRRASPDNVLGCDMFQDEVRVAAGKPIRIACRLLAEENDGQP